MEPKLGWMASALWPPCQFLMGRLIQLQKTVGFLPVELVVFLHLSTSIRKQSGCPGTPDKEFLRLSPLKSDLENNWEKTELRNQ